MTLMTLGDSHSLFSFAGVANAKIFWRGPVTMHRAARDGIASLIPRNCRPKSGDVLILSFGEIDSRTHIPRLARANGRPTSEETDLLLDRFEEALRHFLATCPAIVALSCIVPFNAAFLEPQWYGSDDECRVDVKAIRDRMNARMAAMGVLARRCDGRSLEGFILGRRVRRVRPPSGAARRDRRRGGVSGGCRRQDRP